MRFWLWGAAAAVVLAVVGGVLVLGNRDMADEPVALVGTWRPVSITGFVVDEERRASNRSEPVITFRGDLTAQVSDGCNVGQIRYRTEAGGGFSGDTSGPWTDIGCENVPNTDVLAKAVRVDVRGDDLTFYGPAGDELGRYARMSG